MEAQDLAWVPVLRLPVDTLFLWVSVTCTNIHQQHRDAHSIHPVTNADVHCLSSDDPTAGTYGYTELTSVSETG
jgi:hypothetical protein